MQKHTMDEVENYIMIWWPVVLFLPKIIRIQ